MNYSGIIKNDSVNGEGMRLTLFVSGCPHRCKGCFNENTWDWNYGENFTLQKELELLKYFEDNIDYLDGLSILGGEPLCNDNIGAVRGFISLFKNEFPNKSVWVWTGYEFETLTRELHKDDILFKNIDVLIDGKFVQELYDKNLKFRGSSNQRVIDIRKTRCNNNSIILYNIDRENK